MNIFSEFEDKINAYYKIISKQNNFPNDLDLSKCVIELPRDEAHGDLASNIALVLAKPLLKNPKEIAELFVTEIEKDESVISAKIAGPGFINIYLDQSRWGKEIADILSKGTSENAQDLAQALILNPGFEDLSKRSLLARFIKLYPEIQDILDGSASSSSQSETVATDDSLIVSQSSYDKKMADLEELNKEKIPANSQAIEAAREHGDLRENAEYHMAKDEQKVLLARQSELQTDLMRAKPTDFTDAPSDSVGIGSIVNLLNSDSGESQQYTILGAWDSDPDKNVLSYLTPLGQQLLGKKVEELVETEIEGTVTNWKIEGLARWVDSQ